MRDTERPVSLCKSAVSNARERKMIDKTRTVQHLLLVLVAFAWVSTPVAGEPTVKDTMDGIVTRMYETLTQEERAQLDDRKVQDFITDEERAVLSTKHWCFDTDVPVIVSVLRDASQSTVPFWLPESKFEKTEGIVENEHSKYEVWRRKFAAGRVQLGINGFDKHRPHYFVGIGPQDPNADLQLTNFSPTNQTVIEFREGAFTYHDWSELVLTKVPKALVGHKLLTTIRGRAREAHLIGAFRNTPFPSSPKPDHICLTWSDAPHTTQTVQWRTSPDVTDGVIRTRKKSSQDTSNFTEVKAACEKIEDRLLANDRFANRFTGVVRDLEPATEYIYTVGSPQKGQWSEETTFTTAPAPGADAPFSFILMSDTHRSKKWGELLTKSLERHPKTAFYTISGDLVGTGLHRDDWDHFFEYSSDVFRQRPVAPALGNHDDQDGLGAWMYLSMFGLPENGPKRFEPERSYSFEYANALFVILDVTSSIEKQRRWLEEQLANTSATWKFVVFHFPPYALGYDYDDIRETWGTVFDRYHVDVVMSGHVHYYLRTHPMNDGKCVESPTDGTVYLITVSVPSRDRKREPPEHVAALFGGGPLYQTFDIDGNRLVMRAHNLQGEIRDEFAIQK